jgi:phenylalanyl-tRNA synthetase alpha chain
MCDDVVLSQNSETLDADYGCNSFEEMPTGTFVESGFWCFDALFVPQLHPARELQDTFYLSGMYSPPLPSSGHRNLVDPSTSLCPPSGYYERVSRVHEHGGYGSIGHRTPWSHEESEKLLLRTHTTASSAAMLYKLAAKCRGQDIDGDISAKSRAEDPSDDGFRPAKLFSIDRVFRNETMDATHLAEFHQVEGVVADRNLTLADLIGALWVLPQPIFLLRGHLLITFQVSCGLSSGRWE